MRKKMPKFIYKVKRGFGKRSPAILTATGILSMGTAAVLAAKETPKAIRLIEEREAELGDELTPRGKLETTWKCYVPALTAGIFGAACLIGAHSVHTKRNAAIATAYKLSETALTEYKKAVTEEIGEEKESLIRKKVRQKKLEETPTGPNNIIITERGNQLCYDGVSGRVFESDLNTIEKAINKVNREMTYDMYISLSDFYDELGLDHTDISDQIGWNLEDGLLEVSFDSMILPDGRPCITLEYHVAPKYDFAKLI